MNQKTALDVLKTDKNVFLTGAAGTGKTFVLRKYIEYLREHKVPVAITASTGIAATHLGGQTIHSWSGLGIKDYLSEWDLDALAQKEYLVKRIRNTKVLIIDEISMLSASQLDSIDLILKTILQNPAPFGGLKVVFSGDFFQLPPVQKDSNSTFAFLSRAWQEAELRIVYLTEQYRQKDTLLQILNAMREASLSEPLVNELLSRLNIEGPEQILKLYTHNADVDKINEKELEKLSGELFESPRILYGNKAKAENFARSLLAPEILRLKKGARVMFVKNAPDGSYVNGSLGEFIDIEYGKPVVRLDTGKEIVVDKSTWELENESGKVLASVEQFPLRLAWAITVHKSQGMSLDAAELDLSKVFVEGQGYVALSRLSSLNGLFLKGINEKAFEVSKEAQEQDKIFKDSSLKLERIFTKYSKEKIKALHEEFLLSVSSGVKKESHIKTLEILSEADSLEKIAKLRSLTVDTIIKHLEKLEEEGFSFDLSHLQDLQELSLDELFDAFEELGTERLKPIFEKFKGKYSYKDLRLARLAYNQSLS